MLSSQYILNGQQLQSSSALQNGVPLGAQATDQVGRKYRFVRAGGSSLVVGNLIQAAATDTAFKDMAIQAAVVVGANTIPVTLGGTSTTANMFLDGLLVVSSGTAMIGQSFHIIGHDVATNGTTCNFYVEEPVTTALTTSGTVTVVKSPYADVIQAPTTQTGMPVGGAVFAITNAQFGWVQNGGQGTALGDATVTIAANMALSPSVSTAGCVTKQVTLSSTVGISMYVATVSAKAEPIFWLL